MSAPCPTFGFHLAFTIAPAEGEPGGAAVRAAFLEHVAALGLIAAPATGERCEFVISGDGTQATEGDRERLVAWLDERPEVASHRAGPLTDLADQE